MGRVFEIALRGMGIAVHCTAVQWGDCFIGGGNLTKSNFDHSENCYLEGGNEPLVGGVYCGGIFPGGEGGMSKFSISGWDSPLIPPSRENPAS